MWLNESCLALRILGEKRKMYVVEPVLPWIIIGNRQFEFRRFYPRFLLEFSRRASKHAFTFLQMSAWHTPFPVVIRGLALSQQKFAAPHNKHIYSHRKKGASSQFPIFELRATHFHN